MFTGTALRRRLVLLFGFSLAICMAFFAFGEILMPKAAGKKVQKDGSIVVDVSNASEGYIMVKGAKSKKRLKLTVEAGGNVLKYDLNANGEYEAFPLQYGSTKYTVTLYQNVEGSKYKAKGKVTVSTKMQDELRCYLYPNQYVNYTEKTECVRVAQDLCRDMADQTQIFKAVRKYILSNFQYDYIKSMTVKPGTLPSIDECWKGKKGICQDLSATTCAMLRSQGVPARLVIGTLDASTPHAWVVAMVDGKEVFFDPTAELESGSKKHSYTTERWY